MHGAGLKVPRCRALALVLGFEPQDSPLHSFMSDGFLVWLQVCRQGSFSQLPLAHVPEAPKPCVSVGALSRNTPTRISSLYMAASENRGP